MKSSKGKKKKQDKNDKNKNARYINMGANSSAKNPTFEKSSKGNKKKQGKNGNEISFYKSYCSQCTEQDWILLLLVLLLLLTLLPPPLLYFVPRTPISGCPSPRLHTCPQSLYSLPRPFRGPTSPSARAPRPCVHCGLRRSTSAMVHRSTAFLPGSSSIDSWFRSRVDK